MLQPHDSPLFVADILTGTAAFPFPPLPTARHEPIDLDTAVDVIANFVPHPDLHETFVMLLDDERRGIGVMVVADTHEPDAVLFVADLVARRAHVDHEIGGAIIATFRPGGADELDDVERWLTIDEQLAVVGVELVEWFVFGGAVSRPRTLLGEPSRWDV